MDPRLVDYDAIKKEMKRQDKMKYTHPGRIPELRKIYVAYRWDEELEHWEVLGFRRIHRLTTRTVRKTRRRFKLVKGQTMKLMDLQDAAAKGPGGPPERQQTLRPDAVPPRPRKTKKQQRLEQRARRPRIAPRAVEQPSVKEAKFIALGRSRVTPSLLPFYLGVCEATTKRAAMKEMRQRYGIYTIELVPVASLSKSLKRRIARGRVVPGAQVRRIA